jgi:outer membrane receptor protein involved in Fe transport
VRTEGNKDYHSITWRANLKYLISDRATVFGGYSRGRRPPILSTARDGNISETKPETVDNYEIGFKYMEKGRFWFDVGLFYYLYNDFQASAFVDMDRKAINAGKARNYGAELSANVTLPYFDLFGNYAYIHARFADNPDHIIPADPRFPDSKDIDFSGQRFSLTPDHSFTLGFNFKYPITRNLGTVFTPTYTYRGETFFQDYNDPLFQQDPYGLLNLNLAFKWQDRGLNISFFCNNALNKKYLATAGGTGMMFGFITYSPSIPRTMGVRLQHIF